MAVTIKELSYQYPDGTTGLHSISVKMARGKRTAILGINGSGKSTLLYHLNGTFLPQKGEIIVLDEPVTKNNLENVRKKVGFLFDYPDHQLFATTVARDVAFGPRNYRFSEEEATKAAETAMTKVGIMELKEKPPYQLSLGQKKRTAIAGVLAMNPDLIVCDEPFSGLDTYAEEQFKSVLDEWINEGKSLIFSTHDIDMVYGWADEVVIMAEGKILEIGCAEHILNNKELMQRAKLRRPILAEIFEDRTEKPRTTFEALKYIKSGTFDSLKKINSKEEKK